MRLKAIIKIFFTIIALFSCMFVQSCSDSNKELLTPVDHFIFSINNEKYGDIQRDFSPSMKSLWINGTFSEQIKAIRKLNGASWSVELSDKQEYETEKGKLKHFNYTVKGKENTQYALTISVIEENNKQMIVNVILIDSNVFSSKPPISKKNKTIPILIDLKQRSQKQ